MCICRNIQRIGRKDNKINGHGRRGVNIGRCNRRQNVMARPPSPETSVGVVFVVEGIFGSKCGWPTIIIASAIARRALIVAWRCRVNIVCDLVCCRNRNARCNRNMDFVALISTMIAAAAIVGVVAIAWVIAIAVVIKRFVMSV